MVMDFERSFWQSNLGCVSGREFIRGISEGLVQELPSVKTTAGPVNVVRVPSEDGPEALRVEVERGFQGRGVMETEVGAEPVNDTRFSHLEE